MVSIDRFAWSNDRYFLEANSRGFVGSYANLAIMPDACGKTRDVLGIAHERGVAGGGGELPDILPESIDSGMQSG